MTYDLILILWSLSPWSSFIVDFWRAWFVMPRGGRTDLIGCTWAGHRVAFKMTFDLKEIILERSGV
jgi:hypothetical protein